MTALIITLIVVGLILLVVEIILIPGFGVAGILGVASIAVSCYLGFSQLGTTAGTIVTITNIVLIVSVTLLVLRSRTWKKASLSTSIEAKVDLMPKEKGIEVGQIGIALTRLSPGGQIKINQNLTEGFARDSIIEAGAQIEVVGIEDNKIFVEITDKKTD